LGLRIIAPTARISFPASIRRALNDALNYHVQDAAEAYLSHLREPEDGKVRFINLTLEDVIEVIRLSDQAHAEALHRRYCNFWLVDGALELNAPTFGLALPRTRQRRKPAARADGSAVTPRHSNKSLEASVMSSTPTRLLFRKKITAVFADGSSKMNLGIATVVRMLKGATNVPVERRIRSTMTIFQSVLPWTTIRA
jgi:hypothetical protein